MGESGSSSAGWGCAQYIFNPIFCWWAGLCSLPVVWTEAKLWLQTMVIMATSFKRTYASIVVFSDPDPEAGHCQPTPPQETPGLQSS